MNIVVIEPEELEKLFYACFLKAFSGIDKKFNQPKSEFPERLNIDQAINFLKDEYGIDVKKSQVYKWNHLNAIPSEKFGKQIIFSKNKLSEWVESRLIPKTFPNQVMNDKLATQARNKGSKL